MHYGRVVHLPGHPDVPSTSILAEITIMLELASAHRRLDIV